MLTTSMILQTDPITIMPIIPRFFLGSIVVSITAYHAGDQGLISCRGGFLSVKGEAPRTTSLFMSILAHLYLVFNMNFLLLFLSENIYISILSIYSIIQHRFFCSVLLR